MASRGDNIPEDVSGGVMLQCAENQQLYVNPLKDCLNKRGDDIPNVYMGPTLQRAESQKPQVELKT